MCYFSLMASSTLIREARLRAGLTQTELAERLGTTQSSIARWEGGGSQPSVETLQRIVRACGLELAFSLVVPDEQEARLLDANLELSPEQRLDQLVRTVRFIEAGREAMESSRD